MILPFPSSDQVVYLTAGHTGITGKDVQVFGNMLPCAPRVPRGSFFCGLDYSQSIFLGVMG